jgi:hypothetical protein
MDICDPNFDPVKFFDEFMAQLSSLRSSYAQLSDPGDKFTDVEVYVFLAEHDMVRFFKGIEWSGPQQLDYAREMAYIWKAAGLIKELGKFSGANSITYQKI